ncbi:hypothetical protein HW132_12765 [Brasilonema sp. CT11]|nr:hypothetical protein [Brasilonema sp. CT11]
MKNLPTTGITPREFCRIWFGIATLSPDEIADRETETCHRKNCVKLLARTLGLAERTVRGWGKGLNFELMPKYYQLTLAYALQAAQVEKKSCSKVA